MFCLLLLFAGDRGRGRLGRQSGRLMAGRFGQNLRSDVRGCRFINKNCQKLDPKFIYCFLLVSEIPNYHSGREIKVIKLFSIQCFYFLDVRSFYEIPGGKPDKKMLTNASLKKNLIPPYFHLSKIS